MYWNIAGQTLDLSQSLLMGILNTDPESFSNDWNPEGADLGKANHLMASGAHILDIGGASSKPGASPVPAAVEWNRIQHLITPFTQRFPISVDTTSAEVAGKALEAGAHIINDVSGGSSRALLEAVAEYRAGYVLTRNLRVETLLSDDPIEDLKLFFAHKLGELSNYGITPEQIVLDPGLGFGRTPLNSLKILLGLSELAQAVSRPLLVGASRKGFLGTVTGIKIPADRDAASLAASIYAIEHGALIVRVHNVLQTQQFITMWQALKGQNP